MARQQHFNIDDAEDYDDGTRAVTYDDGSDGGEMHSSDDDQNAKLSSSRKARLQSAKRQEKERAASLRVKNWDAGLMESAEYAGKVVKRKDVTEAPEEEEDEGMASPDEDAMAEWSDAEPFGASGDEEEQSEEEEVASDADSDEDDEEEDDDDDQNTDKLLRGFEKEDAARLISSKDSAKLVEKATHVRHQKLIWERCLEVQIYTKRLLTTTKQIADLAPDDAETNDTKESVVEQLYACIDSISALQAKLGHSTELELPSSTGSDAGKKRKRSSPESLWAELTQASESALPRFNDVLNTYTNKTNLAAGTAGSQAKKFKAVNQDILAQVESVLADPQRVKRKAHAPRDASSGDTTGEDNDDEDALDELMYDDSDFYQQLLKEFIESGAGGAAQDALLRRTHRKKKKMVNRKASKGRVIRFTVHPKLENFMFPDPYPASGMDVEELFRSLFGQSRQT
ncbi:hypothetical protein P43SY_004846 [Pythium insidiosum]|uniref:Apoptosis antagonizing transcription factor n=1 Tax=Pythium insidiosum TaxID=114742 RepID=A0AAD5Q8A6_PYTIN|nr:hypothetical protein P43SY_004846 [Pythium insidiosum]